jgi:hypothetical protein
MDRRGFERQYSEPVLHKDKDGHVTVEWPNGKLGHTVWSDNMVDEFVKVSNQVADLKLLINTLHDYIETLLEERDALARVQGAL